LNSNIKTIAKVKPIFYYLDAYKKADRKRIDGRRICVEIEKGRTEAKWKPRRLGGGKGDTRACPQWLESELKQTKEAYPELIQHFKPYVHEQSKSVEKSGKDRDSNRDSNYSYFYQFIRKT